MNNDAETPVNQKVVWDLIKINEQDKDTIIKLNGVLPSEFITTT